MGRTGGWEYRAVAIRLRLIFPYTAFKESVLKPYNDGNAIILWGNY